MDAVAQVRVFRKLRANQWVLALSTYYCTMFLQAAVLWGLKTKREMEQGDVSLPFVTVE